jgi:hypothetical protein
MKGGKADKKQPKDFESGQLRKGIKTEMEHTNDKSVAREIAMDHLTEDSKYYDKLKIMEGKKMEKKPGSADHLKHPQIKKKDLVNDHAAHLHHPQINAGGMDSYDPDGCKPFDPKKGFKNE